ncbi:MAG: segregation and condensation protein A [Gammaproteobacteria bacterium]|nr:segregation and condensation protein A [Gammaproteobacteria bacterium]
MSVETELSKEEQVLQMMKKVLTDVAKETFTRPGLKHPLSDSTILGIRDCLSLITARERELAEEQGRPMNQRPRFIDEPQTSVVVSLDSLKSDNKED